jgi:hypothetical protein
MADYKHEDRHNGDEGDFWITPVSSTSTQTAETIIQNLVGERKAYAFGWHSHGRKALKVGDWICFYVAKKGVVGHARVTSPPQETLHDWLPRPERYPWVFRLENIRLYLDHPIRFELTVRKKLEAFKGRENEDNFGWFVRSTHRISKKDYDVLTEATTNA